MGLLNKLKNVLFEEEEIEETFIEEPEDNTMNIPKTTMELPKMNKEVKKEKPIVTYDVEDESDRELFKAERTFDFPAFDEDEFDDFSTITKEEKKVENFEVREHKPVTPRKNDYTPTRVVKTEEEEPKKIFRPSPVISPVYGILDKNYKKEDVLTREEVNDKKNIKLDVDSVRKKAFGTLEEDLAATLTEPIEKFYEEPKEEVEPEKEKIEIVVETTSETTDEVDAQAMEEFIEEAIEEIVEEKQETENLDNLLENTVDIEIDVTKEMEIPSRLDINEYEDDEEISAEENEEVATEEIDTVEEVESEPQELEIEKEEVSDDTLENDLFDLIDSMYENGDDDE